MSAAATLQLTRGKLNRLAHVGLDSFAYRERAIADLRGAAVRRGVVVEHRPGERAVHQWRLQAVSL